MKSGTNIDCKYIIRVRKLMQIAMLPRPRKRITHLKGDGEILPIISLGWMGLWNLVKIANMQIIIRVGGGIRTLTRIVAEDTGYAGLTEFATITNKQDG